MPSHPTYTIDQKIQACEDLLSGTKSVSEICIELGMSHRNSMTIYKWADKYKIWGADAFISSKHNKSYTKEFKIQVVEEFLTGKGSVRDIVAKYDIGSKSMLERWIKSYNANKELKDYCPKPEVYMAEARRKTTIDERKKIVEYCLEHNRNYKETATIYDVSYNQVYSWTKKYEEVDELERLRRENIRLKKQLKEKDMLAQLLKKVQEFERM